ncbi:MAG: recombinase family protein [Ktedonobacteraceae bacterium]|nr:recombinase family protein [Ktedonobacteraceae bacterium]
MSEVQVALYARVSSEQQTEAKTIERQRAEIRAWIAADGIDLSTIVEFVDDGYSGSTLVRPALERLRDAAVAGGIDRLYVHCPDRFARNYASSSLTGRGTDRARCRGDFPQSSAWTDSRRPTPAASPGGDCRI